MTGTFATGCAELLGSTSPCTPLRRRHDKHLRLDVTVRACRMLPEVLCAREATSPIMPFEVNTPIALSLKPWTLVQIVTAPNIIDNLPPFPPFHLYSLISTLSAPLRASILSFDYSLRLLLPSCVFFLPLFMIFTRDLTTNHPSRQQKTIHTSYQAETGADVKGAERLSC